MIYDFGLDIGEVVYYVKHHGLAQNNTVEQGKIFGFQIRKQRRGIVVGVDFKENNNVPICYVSRDREIIQEIVNEYNSKSINERICD